MASKTFQTVTTLQTLQITPACVYKFVACLDVVINQSAGRTSPECPWCVGDGS